MNPRHLAPLAALLATAACSTKPPVLAASDPRNEGISKVCTPTNPDFTKPGPYNAGIAMSNDGWCGVFAVERDGRPFSLGLVRARPAHGRVFIQKVENATRVEYTPDAGFAGTDAFTVALRSNQSGAEDSTMAVSVNVAQGDRPAAAAPTTANRPEPARTPARRTTTRRTTSSTGR